MCIDRSSKPVSFKEDNKASLRVYRSLNERIIQSAAISDK
ncbi:1241_t:CDS:2 [Funneliformis caledonium]|uniref:1241_t:CDS:1 n=1 Tax=Funneliformis caledonium TaxID=1117310 RepID=A0A9N9DG08_9GLOM|nr:1241_t:CDS:2 [Funneliformis caledonium]